MTLQDSCGSYTVAARRYQRRLLSSMGLYFVVVFGCTWVVRHAAPHGALLYLWAVLPAIPVIATLAVMGRYLKEETDEFERMQVVQSVLMGAAALLTVSVVSDFLRTMANTRPLPPFWGFVIFFVAMGVTKGLLRLRNRVPADE